MRSVRTLVFVHPSDELYGADRMLLEILAAVAPSVTIEVWLPTDLVPTQHSLCAELERRGVDVRHVDLPVLRRAYRTPLALARLLMRIARTSRALRRRAPDAVYCTSSAVLLAVASARLAGVSTVLAHIQEIWRGTDTRVLAPFAARCERVLAISTAAANSLPARVAAKTVVVVNATDDPGVPTALAGRAGPLHFLVASRWNAWKGHATLMRAWELAGCPGRLTVLGGPPPSGQRVDVPELVRRLAHPDSVSVIGEVADPRPYIEQADVVLVPSDEPEPFGLVAIEAFAAGRPVIGSAAGGLADVVREGVDGWMFPPRDADALGRILRELTREHAAAAGILARAEYERAYTPEAYARRWRNAVTGTWNGSAALGEG